MGKKKRKKKAAKKRPPTDGVRSGPAADAPMGDPFVSPAAPTETGAGEDREPEPTEGTAPPTPSNRRDFLAMSGNLLVGACGLAAVAGGLRMAVPDFDTGAPVRFSLGLPADFKMHTLTWLREHDVFVIHDQLGYGVFSARCTHLGCTVRRTAAGFACPCHGARFDPLGKVLAGPARSDLPWFSLWREADGRLWVDTSVQVLAGSRPLEQLSRAGWPEGT